MNGLLSINLLLTASGADHDQGCALDKGPTRLQPCALRSASNCFIFAIEPAVTTIIVIVPNRIGLRRDKMFPEPLVLLKHN